MEGKYIGCVNIPEYIGELSHELELEGVQGLEGNEMEIIALIRNCPFLFDRSYDDFKDIEKKNSAWEAIAGVFNVTAFEMKQYWKQMRESYCKYTNRLKSDPNAKSCFTYFDEMKFLLPFIHRRNRPSGSSNNAFLCPKEESISSPSSEQETGSVDAQLNLDVLVSAVKNNPILYDRFHKDAKNHDLKLKTWRKLAKELGIPISECVSRWKKLREKYGRERKCRKKNDVIKKWNLYDDLSFLEDHVASRRRFSHTRVQNDKSNGNFHTRTPDTLQGYIMDTVSNSFVNEHGYCSKTYPGGTELDIDFKQIESANNKCQKHEEVPSNDSSNLIEKSFGDEDELFALAVAAELKHIKNPKKKIKLKAEIYRLLGIRSCGIGKP